jgi:hypothetical protein
VRSAIEDITAGYVKTNGSTIFDSLWSFEFGTPIKRYDASFDRYTQDTLNVIIQMRFAPPGETTG